jgi:hypothetical protein
MLRLLRARARAAWVRALTAIRSGLIQTQKAAEIDTKKADYLSEVGSWRKYLGDELMKDGHKEEALREYRLALTAYQAAAKRFPGDKGAEAAILEINGLGVQ